MKHPQTSVTPEAGIGLPVPSAQGQPGKQSVTRLAFLLALAAGLTGAAVSQDPSPRSPTNDLALNADASLSDNGWGGGTSKTDIVSGNRIYGPYDPSGPNEWARGLALPWDGQMHQVTIDFRRPVTFGTVIQWHHGAGPAGMNAETPASYSIQYWNQGVGDWSTILSTSNPAQFLKYPNAVEPQWWYYWSTPYENSFSPVTSSKIRIQMTPQPGRYNWVWQVEAYAPVPEPATLLALGAGGTWILSRSFVKRRRP